MISLCNAWVIQSPSGILHQCHPAIASVTHAHVQIVGKLHPQIHTLYASWYLSITSPCGLGSYTLHVKQICFCAQISIWRDVKTQIASVIAVATFLFSERQSSKCGSGGPYADPPNQQAFDSSCMISRNPQQFHNVMKTNHLRLALVQ